MKRKTINADYRGMSIDENSGDAPILVVMTEQYQIRLRLDSWGWQDLLYRCAEAVVRFEKIATRVRECLTYCANRKGT